MSDKDDRVAWFYKKFFNSKNNVSLVYKVINKASPTFGNGLMSYLIVNESLMTAGRNIVDGFKVLFDSKAWANTAEGWNNSILRNKQNFNTRFDFSKISRKVSEMIQKYHPAVFKSNEELDKMMIRRMWSHDINSQLGYEYSIGAKDLFNKAIADNIRELHRHPFSLILGIKLSFKE